MRAWLVGVAILGLIAVPACADPLRAERDPRGGQPVSAEHEALVTMTADVPVSQVPTVEAGSLTFPGGQRFELSVGTRGSLIGWLSPRGVPTDDGYQVVYNAWTPLIDVDPARSFSDQGIQADTPIAVPSLRVVDLRSGRDVLVQDGAYSAALDASGRFAFVRGQEPEVRAGAPYLGQLVVADMIGSDGMPWSEKPERYIVAGWAGSHLLVYLVREGERLDLIAFDGPGVSRVLAEDADLVAISPDGRDVLVSQSNATPPVVRVLDVATGDERGSQDLFTPGTWDGDYLHFIGYGGSWVGSRVVADSDLGIVVLDIVDGKPSIVDVLRMPTDLSKIPPHEPRLTDGGTSFEAWTPVETKNERRYLRLRCDIGTRSCDVSEILHTGDVFGFVYNPSGGDPA